MKGSDIYEFHGKFPRWAAGRAYRANRLRDELYLNLTIAHPINKKLKCLAIFNISKYKYYKRL